MKIRKFMIDDVEVIEQEPHRRTIFTYNDGILLPLRVHLPYCVTFLRKHIYRVGDCDKKIKTLHFGFSLEKWDRSKKLLLAPLNLTFNDHLLVCIAPTLDDFWGRYMQISDASYLVMDATFGNLSRWSNLSEEDCWKKYRNWPKTLKYHGCYEYTNNRTGIVQCQVDYDNVIAPLTNYAIRHIAGLQRLVNK